MLILSPSILAADFAVLGKQIKEADEAGAPYLHIDVMDGNFVPSISFGMPVISSIRKVTGRIFDVHLMVERPERYVEEFAACGADIITFHLEACGCVAETVDRIHRLGRKAGLSIKPATPVEEILPYADSLDMLLVMTVEPGFGGQKYMESATEKIRAARGIFEERGISADIQVDGGITLENLHVVVEAGANVIVSGSSIFRGDVGANTRNFLRVMGELERENPARKWGKP